MNNFESILLSKIICPNHTGIRTRAPFTLNVPSNLAYVRNVTLVVKLCCCFVVVRLLLVFLDYLIIRALIKENTNTGTFLR